VESGHVATGPTDVGFVWNAQYGGLRFSGHPTTVLQVQSAQPPTYLRATVLDDFKGDAWAVGRPRASDSLEPPAARRPENQTPQVVTVEALADTHLARQHPDAIRRRWRRAARVIRAGLRPARPEPPAGLPVHGLSQHPAAGLRLRCAGRRRTTPPSSRTRGCWTSARRAAPPFGRPNRRSKFSLLRLGEDQYLARAACGEGGGRRSDAVRRGREARAVVRLLGHLPLLESAARGRAAARRVRHPDARGLLPVLRGRDGAHAALSGHSRPGRRRLRRRDLRSEAARLERHRP
jgi:hypothetical protein